MRQARVSEIIKSVKARAQETRERERARVLETIARVKAERVAQKQQS